jgi:hypothetical protein
LPRSTGGAADAFERTEVTRRRRHRRRRHPLAHQLQQPRVRLRHVPHLDRAGDAAELGQSMQEDEAGGGVQLLEPAAVDDAVIAGQAQGLDLRRDRGNVGEPPASLQVQDVGAALQLRCDPHRQGCNV